MVTFLVVLFDSPPTANYSLLGPQICQVTPLITTVQTVYDQTSIVNVIQPPVDQQPLPDPTGDNVTGILFFPAFMVWSTFVRSQGLSANMMGDKLLAFNLGGANYTLGLVRMDVARFHNHNLFPFSDVHRNCETGKLSPRNDGISWIGMSPLSSSSFVQFQSNTSRYDVLHSSWPSCLISIVSLRRVIQPRGSNSTPLPTCIRLGGHFTYGRTVLRLLRLQL